MLIKQKNTLTTISLTVGAILLVWMSAVALFSAVLFFIPSHAITHWDVIVPSLVTLAVGFLLVEGHDPGARRLEWVSIGAAAVLVVLVVLGAGMVYDNSWDGQDYQQKAVLALADGFNPVYETAEPQDAYDRVPLNHYPKAPWTIATALYKTTGNLEAGKAPAALLMLASFFITFAFLLRDERINMVQAGVLAALAAFNPVSVSQYLNFYVDGMGASAMVLLVVLLLWAASDRLPPKALAALGCAVLLGLNIKFTTTAYVAMLALALFAYAWFARRSTGRLATIKPVFATLAVSTVLGLVVLGYNPYVRNTIRHGNPFYPIFGNAQGFNKDYVMSNQLPKDFEDQGTAYRLFRSFFSKAWDMMAEPETTLKVPFVVSFEELLIYRSPDLRIGGFGPWFGGILIVTVVCLGLLWWADRRVFRSVVGLAALLIASGLVNEASWWPRYTPQFWFVPLLALWGLWVAAGNRPQRSAALALAALLVINLAMAAVPYTGYNVVTSMKIERRLSSLAQTGDSYLFFLGPFTPWEVKLQQHQIHYQLASQEDDLPCPERVHLISYSPLKCPPSQ